MNCLSHTSSNYKHVLLTWREHYIAQLRHCTGREVSEPADRRLQTRRMHFAERHELFYYRFITVLVKQHGYIQWTNCTKNTLLGN